MRTVTLNKKVLLQQRKQVQGHNSNSRVFAEKEVFAAVRAPSLSFKNSLAASGFETDLTVILWRDEFKSSSYTHILIDDVLYRIASVGVGINDMFVSVALARG